MAIMPARRVNEVGVLNRLAPKGKVVETGVAWAAQIAFKPETLDGLAKFQSRYDAGEKNGRTTQLSLGTRSSGNSGCMQPHTRAPQECLLHYWLYKYTVGWADA